MEIKRHFTENGFTPPAAKLVTVPGCEKPVEVPEFWSETAAEIAASKYFRKPEGETSVYALMDRVVDALRTSGESQGYFANLADAQAFGDELKYILLHQMGSFNSPVYFNVGIFARFGVAGDSQNFAWNGKQIEALSTAYIRPQAAACFIQDVRDDLLGIFELLKNEAKLFKYGSGTGTNFSRLRARGEKLEGGGESTGLISYLEIFDKAAQAIKSGGTTRRAAKMVVLDADHPEIQEFIRWKMMEERKARVLLAAGFSGGMEGEAMRTVSGQNSNNSVRVSDEFMRRARVGESWSLRARRKSGQVLNELPARQILQEMARAAWECADPGIQFHDTIQKWHVCPNAGPIRASNPCSEFMFLDDSACNLASLNLVRFLKSQGFDWAAFRQTVRMLLIAQDILVDYASYPTARIAENSHCFRPLGLGYANLGGLLMRLGIPYDSARAAEWTAQLTGAMHAEALATSQELAEGLGAFPGWESNRASALKVLAQHQRAWSQLALNNLEWATDHYNRVCMRAAVTGLRNAQVTLIAPTGTIGLLMDCETLGIEPDFALVKRKTLAGGGELLLLNHGVGEALHTLGYSAADIAKIVAHVRTQGTPLGAPEFKAKHAPIFDCALAVRGFPERRVGVEGHLRILAAAQPFLSGAISKTVNLPVTTTVQEVEQLFFRAWELGLKSLAIYRDGSKALQPLCAEC